MGWTTLTVPAWSALAAVLVGIAATASDVRSRRIPNVLTVSALVAALAVHGIVRGPLGALAALTGALVAGAILLPGWLLGWTGAGDVKAMAAIGAWLAFPASLMAALASLVAGGVIALAVAARHRAVGRSLMGAARLATSAGARAATTGIRFPFATAILAGSLASLWLRL